MTRRTGTRQDRGALRGRTLARVCDREDRLAAAWMAAGPFVITASRGYLETAEWFDLAGGEATEPAPGTVEDALAVAVGARRLGCLAGWAITVYQGMRERGLNPVATFSELA